MIDNYKYSISQGGLLLRENDDVCEVFINGEWVYPETSVGYLMPTTASKAHMIITEALKNYYHLQPEYKNKSLPGC